jgi:hypothetical protein
MQKLFSFIWINEHDEDNTIINIKKIVLDLLLINLLAFLNFAYLKKKKRKG